MPQTDEAVEVGVSEPSFEAGKAAFDAEDARFAAIANGDAGGIVAAILEAAQAIEEDAFRILFTDVTDDSAHGFAAFSLMFVL
jgi:hypothetical protein